MGLLWLVTLIWAFSFSLIGEFLSGRVDPYLAVSSRMLLALSVIPALVTQKHQLKNSGYGSGSLLALCNWV